MDQFHLNVWISPELPASATRGIRRTLNDPHFQAALQRSVRALVRRYPKLRQTRFTWSQ